MKTSEAIEILEEAIDWASESAKLSSKLIKLTNVIKRGYLKPDTSLVFKYNKKKCFYFAAKFKTGYSIYVISHSGDGYTPSFCDSFHAYVGTKNTGINLGIHYSLNEAKRSCEKHLKEIVK